MKKTKSAKYRMAAGWVFVPIVVLFGFPAHAADRNKTLSDVMQETMETQDVNYLLQTHGTPYNVAELKTVRLYEWNEKEKKGNDICTRLYAVDRAGKIVGWNTDCDRTTGYSSYGKVSQAASIPAPVIHPEVASYFDGLRKNLRRQMDQALAESKKFREDLELEKARKAAEQEKAASERRLTFPEILMAWVGKSEEEVAVKNSDALISKENFSNGKTVRGYRLDYHVDRYSYIGDGYGFDYDQKIDCKYRLIFVKEKVVGYDAGDCPTTYGKYDPRRALKSQPATAPRSYP